MKKVRVMFASAACLVAGAGVYANVIKASLLPTYYVPDYANRTTTTPRCSIILTSGFCTGNVDPVCTITHSYGANGNAVVLVSKKLTSNGSCVAAQKITQ